MKKYILILFIGTLAFQLKSQVTEGFENVTLDSGKVLNGSDGETAYQFFSGSLKLPVYWDTSFGGFWSSGWAISRKIDSATIKSNAGRHLFCAKTGTGFGGSKTYAVGQNGSWFSYKIDKIDGMGLTGFMITNTTYAYNSMKLGDFFGKKFGGKSGKDPDYFFVRVKSWHSGKLFDSSDIYLADFRSSDSTKDYILRDWKSVYFNRWVTDSVTFQMFSSDTGMYGINTPGFFAIDNIAIDFLGSTKDFGRSNLKVYPNPANENLIVSSENDFKSISVFDINGKLVFSTSIAGNNLLLDVSQIKAGTYFVRAETNQGFENKKAVIIH